jgi:D-threonine aldolase
VGKLDWYQLKNSDELLTPCLLVYPEIIRNNFREAIRMAGGTHRLRPHVKTHKTPQIVQIALELGIDKHKCATLMEAQMLAESGAPDVLIAYPVVGPAVEMLAHLVQSYTQTQFRCVVDNLKTMDRLSQTFAASSVAGKSLDVLVDIDCGMHRTGIPAGNDALELYVAIDQADGLTAGGLHVYDGHNHQVDLSERQQSVHELWKPVHSMMHELANRGLKIPRIVCGGTPTFPVFASMRDIDLECSPGTCALSDFNYHRNYQEMASIRPAAVLMARVITRCGENRLTLDLGYKAVSGDQPAGRRCHILNIDDAKEVGHSEEHLVIETSHADQFNVGDVVYALPAHVCPTVALHSHLQVIENGELTDSWAVTARDRFYHLPILGR